MTWALIRPGGDFLLLCGALTLALGGINATTNISGLGMPLLMLPPLITCLAQARGFYQTRLRTPFIEGTILILAAVSIAVVAAAATGALINGQIPVTGALTKAWLYSLVTLIACRALFVAFESWARTNGLWRRPVLIIGAGVVGARVARRLEDHPEYGLTPIGFLDEDPRSPAEVGGRAIPILGTINDLEELALRHGVRDLVVAFSSIADERLSRLVQRGPELGLKVTVVPRMFDTINDRVRYDTLGGLPMQSLATVNPRGIQFAIKHAIDRILSLLILILFSPIMLCIAITIRFTSPGPALFTQKRIGRDGREFDFYKFRSMRASTTHNEHDDSRTPGFRPAIDSAPGGLEGEDRRTAIGRFLRRASFDELPQLLNVLRGDMSLVGPRPERPEYVKMFQQDVLRYSERHRVKSGITGWSQIHGLRGQTSVTARVEFDSYYIAHWSLALDLKILALTPLALLRKAE